jgi:hypothetical protein
LYQVPIEKRVIGRIVIRNNAVIVHHGIAARWWNASQPSAVMQSRIDRALEEWTNETHFVGEPDSL